MSEMQCPCGSGKQLAQCCGPYIEGTENAPTAEALMRSRYTAYVINKTDYIGATLTAERQEDHDDEAVRNWAGSANWLGLEILDTELGREKDDEGMVAFECRYEMDGETHEHRERSYFRKEDGKWFYVTGDMIPPATFRRETPKVGRNEPCPCGSGKKFKKCCGK